MSIVKSITKRTVSCLFLFLGSVFIINGFVNAPYGSSAVEAMAGIGFALIGIVFSLIFFYAGFKLLIEKKSSAERDNSFIKWYEQLTKEEKEEYEQEKKEYEREEREYQKYEKWVEWQKCPIGRCPNIPHKYIDSFLFGPDIGIYPDVFEEKKKKVLPHCKRESVPYDRSPYRFFH